MNNQKIILGLVGEMASGKGTAVDYLKEKYSATSHRFSTSLRDVLDRLYVETTRPNLQKLSLILRENFGQNIFAKIISGDVENDQNNLVIVDGIRRPADIEYLSKLNNFHLIYITADIKNRYERITKRGENEDDTSKTFEQFQKDHEADTEVTIPIVAKEAKITINNDGDFDKLYQQLDEIVKSFNN